MPRKIGQGWVDADQILPLLDGLDEVARDARAACVQQINDYYQSRLERGSSPIVICCRSEEYAALSTRIMLQHAVSILPLTDEQINTYLEQAGEPVKALMQALNEDTELRSLARQPLMLNIFTFAYQGARASEVPTGATREELQHTIFATYVEHMLKRRGQSKRWEPEQVIGWLTFLAKQMQEHDQTVFFVENLQPTWLSMKWRILYQWCVVLVVGLVSGPVVGPACGFVLELFDERFIGPTDWLTLMRVFGPTFWLLLAAACGFAVGQSVGLETRINPVEVLTWSWEKVRSELGIGLFFIVFMVLVCGLAASRKLCELLASS